MSQILSIKVTETQSLQAIYKRPSESATLELETTLIIMLHGVPGHKASQNDLYGDLEHILNDKGFHTMRFDFRGFGKSDGDEKDFTTATAKADMNAIFHWAEQQDYKNFVFIAEGLGATIGMLNIPLKLRGFIMLWPGLNPQYLAENTLESFSDKLPADLKRINLSTPCKEIVMPTLILHGAEDTLYPVQQLEIARKHMVSKRIEITTFHDGDHGLTALNHRKMLFYNVTQFLNKYV